MRKLLIGWSSVEELENIKDYGVDFKTACEVVKNQSSLKIRNLFSDFVYIGPSNDLSIILIVNCKIEDGFIKIFWSRKANGSEEDSYFNHLAKGITQ